MEYSHAKHEFKAPPITEELYKYLKNTSVEELTKRFRGEAKIDLRSRTKFFFILLGGGAAVISLFGASAAFFNSDIMGLLVLGVAFIWVHLLWEDIKEWNSLRLCHKERLRWHLKWKETFGKTRDYEDFQKRSRGINRVSEEEMIKAFMSAFDEPNPWSAK